MMGANAPQSFVAGPASPSIRKTEPCARDDGGKAGVCQIRAVAAGQKQAATL